VTSVKSSREHTTWYLHDLRGFEREERERGIIFFLIIIVFIFRIVFSFFTFLFEGIEAVESLIQETYFYYYFNRLK
jgi:hypothetical protein